MHTRLMPFAVLLACAAPGSRASAHAVLMGSEPQAHATVAPGPAAGFVLRFNSRIDRGRSRLSLVRPDRTEAVLPLRDDGPPDTLRTRAESLVPGPHVLRWQVLAVDGHITRGELPFAVGPGTAAPGTVAAGPARAGGE